jgi:drug/metabolite transporter (DMT)-like permease
VADFAAGISTGEKFVAKWAYWLIAAAAALWGIIGLFVKGLAAYGFSPLQIVAVRVAVSAAGLVAYAAARDRGALAVRPADAGLFVGTGIFSVLFFNWCYFTAIGTTSVAVAAVLLYTAPAFVAVLSRVVFGEALTGRKAAAVAVTFVGCALVTGVLPGFAGAISPLGLLAGLGAGAGYALYSIFGKLALRRYGALTVTIYTFVFAAAASLPFSGLWEQRALFAAWQVWGYVAGLGLFSTVLAYLLYTVGLTYVEPGRAAVTATLEPLVAAAMGAAVFGETLTGWQLAGMALVIAAVAGVQKEVKGDG